MATSSSQTFLKINKNEPGHIYFGGPAGGGESLQKSIKSLESFPTLRAYGYKGVVAWNTFDVSILLQPIRKTYQWVELCTAGNTSIPGECDCEFSNTVVVT